MYAFITGTIRAKRKNALIIEAGGIGYLVEVPLRASAHIGDTISLSLHTHITEGSHRLFGLPTEAELALFETLLKISGIGPSAALTLLELPLDHLTSLIEREDATALTRLPGIGSKTASRIILELRGKLTPRSITPSHTEEAMQALLSLGFPKKDIDAKLKQLPETITSSEDIVRFYLTSA